MAGEIEIFVYGSCHYGQEPDRDDSVGNGGYGVVILKDGRQLDQLSGGYSATTNARMDIVGITEGLQRVRVPGDIVVYTPNGYVLDTLTKGWLEKWKRKGFKKKKHADLWRRLDAVLQKQGRAISFQHARAVRSAQAFQLAEELGKAMSAKQDLPVDLEPEEGGLFEMTGHSPVEHSEMPVLQPVLDSVCVDASALGHPGPTEYRGVDCRSGKILFQHRYPEATQNIGGFLAIVHALALNRKQGKPDQVVYIDSVQAIAGVKQKKCETTYIRTANNAVLFGDIQRAVDWLVNHPSDAKVLKWNTAEWGPIPAEYDRE